MSGVVVEVRVKEGAEIKKGDPVCGKHRRPVVHFGLLTMIPFSDERDEGTLF